MKSNSNTKIITFILFLCAAILTSIFVFYNKNKTASPPANNTTTIFTMPRDIKNFALFSKNNEKFDMKNFLGHDTLLVFGFTHCSNVCPITLEMLNHAYSKLHAAHPHLQVVLVSLDPERDTPDNAHQYAQTFNPAFIGVTGKLAEVRKLQSQFGIYSARADDKPHYQIQHTSSILWVNAKGQWAGLFKYGMTPAQFAHEFENNIK
jgi:protein SCO1